MTTPDGKTAVPVTAPVKLTAQPANIAKGEKVAYYLDLRRRREGYRRGRLAHLRELRLLRGRGDGARRAGTAGDDAKTTLNVLPPAPQAVIKATQDRAYSYMLSADGTGSTGAELHYYWDFGDGHASESGDDRTISHLYLAAGTYTLTLTVVDVAGQQSVATKQITVKKL